MLDRSDLLGARCERGQGTSVHLRTHAHTSVCVYTHVYMCVCAHPYMYVNFYGIAEKDGSIIFLVE